MSRTFKLAVNRAVDTSGQSSKDWVEVKKVSSGIYEVVGYGIFGHVDSFGNNALGIRKWDEEVVDLDAGNSDESQCFGMSDHLRWKDVDIRAEEFRASSLQRLQEALTHVVFCVWNQDEI